MQYIRCNDRNIQGIQIPHRRRYSNLRNAILHTRSSLNMRRRLHKIQRNCCKKNTPSRHNLREYSNPDNWDSDRHHLSYMKCMQRIHSSIRNIHCIDRIQGRYQSPSHSCRNQSSANRQIYSSLSTLHARRRFQSSYRKLHRMSDINRNQPNSCRMFGNDYHNRLHICNTNSSFHRIRIPGNLRTTCSFRRIHHRKCNLCHSFRSVFHRHMHIPHTSHGLHNNPRNRRTFRTVHRSLHQLRTVHIRCSDYHLIYNIRSTHNRTYHIAHLHCRHTFRSRRNDVNHSNRYCLSLNYSGHRRRISSHQQ